MKEKTLKIFYTIILALLILTGIWITLGIIQLLAVFLVFLLIFEPIIFWIIIFLIAYMIYLFYKS